ncbi:permease [Streptomyces longispororuber]|uniref:Permease n=1 Tax=Streptomyces longispororuber TaxID=68230 RepID=A0A918ZEL3_9ACTN|nr:DMT family transporter [Streptomyces longispororuber]GHE48671.1 permease [Streptomyces longispororuber]
MVDYAIVLFVWGMSFAVQSMTQQAFGWVGVVAFRSLIAGTFLAVIALVTQRTLDFGAGWRPFAVVGATTVAAQYLGLSFAIPRAGTAITAILSASIPLFSLVIGHAWGHERMTVSDWLGLFLGSTGILLLVGFPAVPLTGSILLGCGAALAGAVAAAYGSNFARVHLRTTGSWEVTIAAFLCGGVLTSPFLVVAPLPRAPGPLDFGGLLVLGVLMSGVAYVLYFRLVAEVGASRAISVEFGVPVIASLAGTLTLDERLSAAQVGGAAAMLTGCVLILDLLPRNRFTRHPPLPASRRAPRHIDDCRTTSGTTGTGNDRRTGRAAPPDDGGREGEVPDGPRTQDRTGRP